MSNLVQVLTAIIGPERTTRLADLLVIPSSVLEEHQPEVSRAVIAQALNMLLMEDLLQRVPDANSYAEDRLRDGIRIFHDHGAVRTVLLDGMGALPAGEAAITRILRPLGYRLNGTFPLERLKMTGRSHAHQDYPEQLAQFFISELHPDRFSASFQSAVRQVTITSVDPLSPAAVALLAELESAHALPYAKVVALLPTLISCFSRQHQEPLLTDYEVLLAESPEMAWISTEGNAFNHATDRVPDVDALVTEQRSLNRPMKATVETSQSGRIRQTAFLAAKVIRNFRNLEGPTTSREVSGSFYEFITRLPIPEEHNRLDLGFDSANAQGIFKMTATGA